MLQIAILDDNSKTLIEYEEKVSAWLLNYKIKGDLVLLTADPNLLMVEINNNSINVCILDINLRDDINGMSIAEQIRKKSYDIEIIFVTGCLEYIQRAFDVRAYQFIPKPGWDKLERTIVRLAEEKSICKQGYFQLNYKKEIRFIPINTVVYIERSERKTVIHTDTKNYETYEGLEKVVNSIKDGVIRQSHRSIYVNPQKIDYIDRTLKLITFRNGDTCCISSSFISDFSSNERPV